MSRLEDVAFKPPTSASDATAAANTSSVVTIPAPGVGKRIYVCGYTVSYSGAIAAAVVPTIVSGSVNVEKFQVPAATVAPIGAAWARAFECPENTSVVATAPAGGTGIVGTMLVRYFIA